MQLFSQVHSLYQHLETVQKRRNAQRLDATAQMPYKLFKTYALRPNIHISVMYIIMIPSQVVLIIMWYLINMHYLSWEVGLRRKSGLERRLAFIKPMKKLFDFKHSFFWFCFGTWCKASGCTLSISQSPRFLVVFSSQKKKEGCGFPQRLTGRAPHALCKETKPKERL